jgi:hypothetical protein
LSSSHFPGYLATLPKITQRVLTQLEFVPGGEQCLRDCLADNRLLRAASDGSLDPVAELSSFRWQILGNGNVLVRGAGPVDGVPDLLSSTRAELFGASDVLEFLFHFRSFFNLGLPPAKFSFGLTTKRLSTRLTGPARLVPNDAALVMMLTLSAKSPIALNVSHSKSASNG